jgi:hypothetical protein
LFAVSSHKWDTVSPTIGRNMYEYFNGLLEEAKIQGHEVGKRERKKRTGRIRGWKYTAYYRLTVLLAYVTRISVL